ncbi:hypothetical protein ABUW04_07120 [Streptacidiphilus sp. N1-10]|uniref:Uncharacterized protein n=1 Tax=Streptacidiphilus jeojiensis TaxID=3229225 RepID=A0ABV6XID6_9ACTN
MSSPTKLLSCPACREQLTVKSSNTFSSAGISYVVMTGHHARAVRQHCAAMRHGLLQWTEAVCARTPTPDKTTQLRLAKSVSLMRIICTTNSPHSRSLEVNDTLMAGGVLASWLPRAVPVPTEIGKYRK